jgi:hypothetical protein
MKLVSGLSYSVNNQDSDLIHFSYVSLGHEFGDAYWFIELDYKALGIYSLNLVAEVH